MGTAKQTVDVGGHRMAYVDRGQGQHTFLLLHGNPTSSALWRDVIPALEGLGRCIAPDLIGMGDSDKLAPAGAGTYRYATHRDFLGRFIERVVPADARVTLVLHDWGSALGFDWARQHPSRVAGIAYMEAIVRPLTWDEWPAESREMFRALRAPAGEHLVLERNLFVEAILPKSILRPLRDEEMEEYRRPFARVEDRWPTLTWPRELPIDGHPADVTTRVQAYADWMSTNDLPKLFFNADPGVILVGEQREFCRRWRNQTEVTVDGLHFLQEDSGPEIGAAIAAWARR